MVLAHFNPSKGILNSSILFTATDKNNPAISGALCSSYFTFVYYVGMWYVCAVQMGVCMCVRECGAQQLTTGVFLHCSPLQILRQGFSLNLETLMELGWLASEFSGFFLLCLSSVETANTGHHAWLSMWVQEIRTQAPMPAHHSALPMDHLPRLPLPVIELRCEMTH